MPKDPQGGTALWGPSATDFAELPCVGHWADILPLRASLPASGEG